MRIACGFDHAGKILEQTVTTAVTDAGHEVVDLGTADDYPEVTRRVAAAILGGSADRGVLVCGSGAGVSVAAAKFPGIRAATVHDNYTAHQGVEHDDLNVLCMGARVIGAEVAREIVQTFAGASFDGLERHARRLAEVRDIEAHGLDASPSK